MKSRTLGALALASLGLAFLYGSVLPGFVRAWTNDDYSHGFLVAPLCAYLVWQRRHQLTAVEVSPSLAGLAVVVVSLLVFVIGELGAEMFLARVSLIGVVAGSVMFVLGTAHARVLALPLGLACLAIPLPAIVFNRIAFPLQLMASRVSEVTLSAFGIPVLREGNLIFLASATLEVAEACSGIRSLMSLMTFAVVYGYFTETSILRRVLLATAMVPIAVVANALRVAGTGFVAHVAGETAADNFFHLFAGWLVFMAAVILLFVLQRLMRFAGSGDHAPRWTAGVAMRRGRTVSAARLFCLAGMFVAVSLAVRNGRAADVIPTRQPLRGLPIQVGAWSGRANPDFDARVVRILGADEYLTRVYRNGTAPPVDLFIGYYGSQRTGAVIHSPLNCLPGAGWQPIDRRRVAVDVDLAASGEPRQVRAVGINRVVVQKGDEQQVALYWYQERGRVIASEYASRAYMVLDAARYGRTDGALVRVTTPAGSNARDVEAAAARLIEFVRLIFPLLPGYVPT
jgi:exosortase D (VPLPA-CTERM-specific)